MEMEGLITVVHDVRRLGEVLDETYTVSGAKVRTEGELVNALKKYLGELAL